MTPTLQKDLKKDVADLIALAPEVESFLAGHSVPAATVTKVRIILEEVILNQINHATGSVTQSIGVRLDVEHDHVIILIEDDSSPFDPRSAPDFDKTMPLEERRPGGMGLQLVRSLANQISYERLSGRNCLRLAVALH